MRQQEDRLILLLTLIIGAVVGLVVVAFILLTENLGSRLYPEHGSAWRRLVVPVVGSLLTGFLLKRYFPNARGSGIPQTKTALFIYDGYIRFRTVVGKFGCSAISLASGIALGREGPSVQVGAGIASSLGRRLGLSPARVRSLVPIGAAAALAAAFNTPIAAVLFTLEEVMGDLHARVLGSVVLSSATSWIVLHLVLGDEPLFHVPSYQLVHPVEFAFYAVLGVAGGIVSVIFVKLLLRLRRWFKCMPAWSEWLQPTAGGLTVGILGWYFPDVLGVGYIHVSQALNGQLALGVMALLVGLKIVATATCYASGNAGGIFGPSLFLGAMMGGAIGAGVHRLLPDYTGSVGAYALVGMGAAFAGIIRVPLTSVIMIFEITRDYSIIVPLMIANLISYFISSRLQAAPIYEALQQQDGIHLPSGSRDREDSPVVGDGVHQPAAVLQADDTVEHILSAVDRTQAAWPVVDDSGLLGMLKMKDLEAAMEDGRGKAAIAELLPPLPPPVKLTAEIFPHVHTDHPLDLAMRRMAHTGLNVLPVVSRTNIRQLVGTISLKDALEAYGLEHEHGVLHEIPRQDAKWPTALLGGVLAGLVALIALAGFLNFFYSEERSARAKEYMQQGDKLTTQARYPEAIEQYRNSLSISQRSEQRLALAEALVKAGRDDEAEIYFRELLRSEPANGPANLGLGRIAMKRGDVEEAIGFYHRAIDGKWPVKSPEARAKTRIELVRALGTLDRRKEARAELLVLEAEAPDEAAAKEQVGYLLLDFGSPQESARVFWEVLQKQPQDANAYAGLGDSEYALGHYRRAQDAFKKALRYKPSEEDYRKRLETTEQILALDPSLPGLRAADRYRRSLKLVEATLGGLDECLATAKNPPATLADLADTGRRALLRKSPPPSYSDAAEENLRLSAQLWEAHTKICKRPGETNEPLDKILARAAR